MAAGWLHPGRGLRPAPPVPGPGVRGPRSPAWPGRAAGQARGGGGASGLCPSSPAISRVGAARAGSPRTPGPAANLLSLAATTAAPGTPSTASPPSTAAPGTPPAPTPTGELSCRHRSSSLAPQRPAREPGRTGHALSRANQRGIRSQGTANPEEGPTCQGLPARRGRGHRPPALIPAPSWRQLRDGTRAVCLGRAACRGCPGRALRAAKGPPRAASRVIRCMPAGLRLVPPETWSASSGGYLRLCSPGFGPVAGGGSAAAPRRGPASALACGPWQGVSADSGAGAAARWGRGRQERTARENGWVMGLEGAEEQTGGAGDCGAQSRGAPGGHGRVGGGRWGVGGGREGAGGPW